MRLLFLGVMETPGCWHCGHPSAESFFCKFCNTLQPPHSDYYRFFGLERRLGIDEADLQKRFYELSRLLHPDRYTLRPAAERQHSLEAAAILNDAYRTLRDPVRRAEYFLRDEGFGQGGEDRRKVPAELLEEVFEFNLALEACRGGDPSARSELEEIFARVQNLQQQADSALQELFNAWDRTGDREVLAGVRALLDRRSYLTNLMAQAAGELDH